MDVVTYALCKKYTNDTADQFGAVKGAPCEVEKVEDIDGGKEITLRWKNDAGVVQRKSFKIMDGVTPLMYMGVPQLEAKTISNGDTFAVNPNNFNRPPKNGDLFFSYLILTDEAKIYLYAVAAMYQEEEDTLTHDIHISAKIFENQKIATTGLKALVAKDAITQDLTQDDPFDLPADLFSRMPDGDAEECLIFDRYGHYRQCTLVQKDSTTITITPTGEPVNINIGKVRYLHTQTDESNEWKIQHNLSFKYPDVLVLDENDNELYPDIKYKTDNMLKLKFSEPVKGMAYISK